MPTRQTKTVRKGNGSKPSDRSNERAADQTSKAAKRLEVVPIDSLTVDPGNLRRHNQTNLDAIKASLSRWGQQVPLLVDANGVVIAGNGRLIAARALGWREVEIVRTSLAGADAIAYGIADNRTAELAEWDTDALRKQFEALALEDASLAATTGFDQNAIDELCAAIDDGLAPSSGSLLAKWNVDVTEPRTLCERGQVWKAGEHTIFVCSVIHDAHRFAKAIADPAVLFCPYPTPDIAMGELVGQRAVVMVQPDPYLAGHLIDAFADRFGTNSVSLLP